MCRKFTKRAIYKHVNKETNMWRYTTPGLVTIEAMTRPEEAKEGRKKYPECRRKRSMVRVAWQEVGK